jgi:ADP-ribose pyrophosphatase YjhB (NUDIX family)
VIDTPAGEDKIRPHCTACGFIFYQNPAPAAGAVIVENEKILLVRRSVNPGRGDWCIPAGFTEWNEHPQQTAVRELKEETGLDISITSIFDIFMGMDDPRTHAVLVLYHAEVVGGKLVAGDDADEAEYFPLDATPNNIAFQAHRDALQLYRDRYLAT